MPRPPPTPPGVPQHPRAVRGTRTGLQTPLILSLALNISFSLGRLQSVICLEVTDIKADVRIYTSFPALYDEKCIIHKLLGLITFSPSYWFMKNYRSPREKRKHSRISFQRCGPSRVVEIRGSRWKTKTTLRYEIRPMGLSTRIY